MDHLRLALIISTYLGMRIVVLHGGRLVNMILLGLQTLLAKPTSVLTS